MSLSRRWRFLIGGILLLGILAATDLPQLWGSVRGVQLVWLLVAVLVFGISHLTLSETLFRLCLGLGLRLRRPALIATHFEALFVGTFLPSSFGVDVVKAVDLGRRCKQPTLVATAIGLQRMVAIIIMLALLGLALPSTVSLELFAKETLPTPAWYAVCIGGALVLLGALLLLRRLNLWNVVLGELHKARAAALRLVRFGSGGLLITAGLLQGASLLLNVTGCFLVSRSLDIPVDWRHFCYIVPATYVAVALPITVSGIGVREGVYSALLGLQGVSSSVAVSLSLLVLAVGLFYSLLGGVVHVSRPESIAAEGSDV